VSSQRVILILKARGAPFSDEEMQKMSDKEGWAWIYANPRKTYKPPKSPEICFTGFTPEEREELWDADHEMGLKIVKSVTKNLTYLCVGEAPGPTKLAQAKEQKCKILTVEEFRKLNI
jgi:DNA ligase (NAD+)